MKEPSLPGAPLRLDARGWQLVAAALAVALYLPSLGYGWAYDDQMEVVRNTFIRSFAHVPEMFTTTVWTGSGMETYLYRPFALVTYAVNHSVSGLSPWSYHLVNVLLHAGAADGDQVRVGRGLLRDDLNIGQHAAGGQDERQVHLTRGEPGVAHIGVGPAFDLLADTVMVIEVLGVGDLLGLQQRHRDLALKV